MTPNAAISPQSLEEDRERAHVHVGHGDVRTVRDSQVDSGEYGLTLARAREAKQVRGSLLILVVLPRQNPDFSVFTI